MATRSAKIPDSLKKKSRKSKEFSDVQSQRKKNKHDTDTGTDRPTKKKRKKQEQTELKPIETNSEKDSDFEIAPLEVTRVYVGRLPKDAAEQAIRQHFASCGEVLAVLNKYGEAQTNGKYKQQAIVEFGDAKAVSAACQLRQTFQGKHLLVCPHDRPFKERKQALGSAIVFVGNLSFQQEPEELSRLFSRCGKVLSVRLPTDEEGALVGYGFVIVQEPVCWKEIMKLNGKLVKGRKIKVGDRKPEDAKRPAQLERSSKQPSVAEDDGHVKSSSQNAGSDHDKAKVGKTAGGTSTSTKKPTKFVRKIPKS
eukprot:g48917.t1